MAGDLILLGEDNEKNLKLSTGFDGHLSEPVDIVELVSVVAEHCRGSAP